MGRESPITANVGEGFEYLPTFAAAMPSGVFYWITTFNVAQIWSPSLS